MGNKDIGNKISIWTTIYVYTYVYWDPHLFQKVNGAICEPVKIIDGLPRWLRW